MQGSRKISHQLSFDSAFRPHLKDIRREIRKLAGPRWGDTSYLLGGWSGPQKDGPFEKWKPNTEMINATIRFALSTTRLNDNRDKFPAQTWPPDPTRTTANPARPHPAASLPRNVHRSISPPEWPSTLGIITTNSHSQLRSNWSSYSSIGLASSTPRKCIPRGWCIS